MSNKKSKKKSGVSSAAPKNAINPSDLQGLAKVKWSSLQTDLKSALGSWSESDHDKVAKSPEQEQLDKVKSLIEDLKQKLSDF